MELNDLQINDMLNGVDRDKFLLDLRIDMFKNGNFDFIVNGIANNSEMNWEKGKVATHEKQKRSIKDINI